VELVLLEPVGLWDLVVSLVQPVQQDLLEPLDQVVIRDSLDLQDQLDHQDLLVSRAPRVSLEIPDLLETPEQLEQPDHLAQLARRVLLDPSEQLG
jgi:hypothetical protein